MKTEPGMDDAATYIIMFFSWLQAMPQTEKDNKTIKKDVLAILF